MKKTLIILLLLPVLSFSQTVYKIISDSTILKSIGTSRHNVLVIRNTTRDTVGALVNTGSGITKFVSYAALKNLIGVSGSGTDTQSLHLNLYPGEFQLNITRGNTIPFRYSVDSISIVGDTLKFTKPKYTGGVYTYSIPLPSGGGSQTFQQTLDQGNTLSKDDTILGNSKSLYILDNSHFSVNQTGADDTTFGLSNLFLGSGFTTSTPNPSGNYAINMFGYGGGIATGTNINSVSDTGIATSIRGSSNEAEGANIIGTSTNGTGGGVSGTSTNGVGQSVSGTSTALTGLLSSGISVDSTGHDVSGSSTNGIGVNIGGNSTNGFGIKSNGVGKTVGNRMVGYGNVYGATVEGYATHDTAVALSLEGKAHHANGAEMYGNTAGTGAGVLIQGDDSSGLKDIVINPVHGKLQIDSLKTDNGQLYCLTYDSITKYVTKRKISTIGGGGGVPYTSYVANLTQDVAGHTYTSGSLIVGHDYAIITYNAGDDFTNVGGTNSSATNFIASGTTPTDWTNGSTLVDLTASLTVDVLENTTGGTFDWSMGGSTGEVDCLVTPGLITDTNSAITLGPLRGTTVGGTFPTSVDFSSVADQIIIVTINPTTSVGIDDQLYHTTITIHIY